MTLLFASVLVLMVAPPAAFAQPSSIPQDPAAVQKLLQDMEGEYVLAADEFNMPYGNTCVFSPDLKEAPQDAKFSLVWRTMGKDSRLGTAGYPHIDFILGQNRLQKALAYWPFTGINDPKPIVYTDGGVVGPDTSNYTSSRNTTSDVESATITASLSAKTVRGFTNLDGKEATSESALIRTTTLSFNKIQRFLTITQESRASTDKVESPPEVLSCVFLRTGK